MQILQRLYPFLAVGLLLLAGCKGEGTDPEVPDYDRAPLLTNYADNLIIPAFNKMETEASNYLTRVEAFTANPDPFTLTDLQNAWLPLARIWQKARHYNFGPADNSFGTLAENIGTWPVDTDLVQIYIEAQDTTLANFDRDTRGIVTLEYLTFGQGSTETIVGYFSGTEGAWARAYLRAVARDVLNQVSTVREQWENGYRDRFVNDLGTSAGSSTSELYNNFVLSYEGLKNFKVAVPLGLRAGQTQVEPGLVEAFYSGNSLELVKLHFEACTNIWEGISNVDGSNGLGFREYLESVTGGPELITGTEEQISNVETALNALDTDTPFSEQVAASTIEAEALSIEMQKMVRFFKSDMSSLLGISITFDSGDGD